MERMRVEEERRLLNGLLVHCFYPLFGPFAKNGQMIPMNPQMQVITKGATYSAIAVILFPGYLFLFSD